MEKILKRLSEIEKRLDKLENKNFNSNSKKTTKSPTSSKTTKSVLIKSGSIVLTQHPNGCIVTGDTFDKKDIIKKYKGWWTPEVKGWTVRIEHYNKLAKDLENKSKTLTKNNSEKPLDIQTNYNTKKSVSNTETIRFINDDSDDE